MLNRRDFVRAAGQAAIAAAVGHRMAAAASQGRGFVLFSKPLPELAWSDLGRAVREAGYEGVDLTVRAKGHVLPERASDDLPRAIDAIKSHGLTVPMITTELTSPNDPTAKPLLQTAARHGVAYFKTGYWRYTSSPDVRAQVAAAGEALTGLAVPWFEQPGGGTAFVLPKSIAELIADGSLVEVEASVGPPSR